MIKKGSVVLMAIVISVFFCPVFVTAAETERFWVKMNPDRFESTSASAFEQCNRAAELPDSGVSKEGCEALKEMLDEEKCQVKMVPDGIRLDWMSTYEDGIPVVVGPMTKKLGRKDKAMVCDVGNGVTTYFFIGEDRSCGNLAFVVERPEVVAVAGQGSSGAAARKCRWIQDQTTVTTSSTTTALMPIVVESCGGVVSVGGGVYAAALPESSFTSSRRVCDD